MLVRKTGATGLEPATSGVTGRLGYGDGPRQTPLNRRFPPRRHILSTWLSQTSKRRFGPQVGHGNLPSRTTPRLRKGNRRSTDLIVQGEVAWASKQFARGDRR